MGVTNIRSPYELIGRGNSMPCVMPELGCHIILDGSADRDHDLIRYTSLLARGLSDEWVCRKTGPKEETILSNRRFASPCNNPRIHISEHIRKCHRERQNLEVLGAGVVCFLVVEGLEGASCQKLVIRASVEQIAELAFFEAANGFNVVFGGLLLKRQLAVLGREGLSFARVKNLDELLEKEKEMDKKADSEAKAEIPFWVCY